MTYTENLGNTMAYLWWKGRRREYFKLRKYLHRSVTGSDRVKVWGLGPFPAGKTTSRRFLQKDFVQLLPNFKQTA